MRSDDEAEDLRRRHAALRVRMPRVWNAFFARFGRLRPVQLEAMPVVVSGVSTLITAPTAGGKTEASVAPICERLLLERWSGLSVLLVTPTRALVNDIFQRLERPLETLGIRIARKTSDHGAVGDSTQFLVTTPESLESLLTFRRERLGQVRAVILDEIHLLDGTPRGDQLRCVLQRLDAYRAFASPGTAPEIQRVAMSATVAKPRELASRYLGPASRVISVQGQRDIAAKVLLVPGSDDVRAAATIDCLEELDDCRKVLVFVNSRRQVDAAASYARGSFAGVPVYGHHGSLAKAERERVEERFRSDERAICVATMTLEVGIDIGDIDVIVCADPPFSTASFLQRIGRGCRRLQGRTRVVCVARNEASELMFHAIIEQARRGIPEGPTVPHRRSVLLQQILAYLRQVPGQRRTRDQVLRVLASTSEPVIEEAVVQAVLQDMTANGLLVDRDGVYEPAGAGRSIIESDRIYSNIGSMASGIAVVDVETGSTIANVREVDRAGKSLRLGGRQYEVMPGCGSRVVHVKGAKVGEQSPRYDARHLPYAYDVGVALRTRLGIRPNELAVVETRHGSQAFTWLGILFNTGLERALAALGITVKARAYALDMQGLDCDGTIHILRRGVDQMVGVNPFANMPVERLSDLGPFFRDLTSGQQEAARRDFLDVDFLRAWVAELEKTVRIEPESEQGRALHTVVKIG